MNQLLPHLLFVLTGLLCPDGTTGETGQAPSLRDGESKSVDPFAAVVDAPLVEDRRALLELAFETASAIPDNPHHKTKSRIQEDLVRAALRIDQDRTALRFALEIDEWRRGMALAAVALHRIEHGRGEAVDLLLGLAEEAALRSEEARQQDWRRHRVLAKVARANLLLENHLEAQRLEQFVSEPELRPVASARVRFLDHEAFEQQISDLDELAKVASFDQLLNLLAIGVELYGQVFADSEQREVVFERLQHYWSKLPIQIRVDTLERLSDMAVSKGDRREALRMLNATRVWMQPELWLAEDRLVVLARLAEKRHAAGDVEVALVELDAAVAFYDERRDSIVDIYRANAVRALAETHAHLGRMETALGLYHLAVRESQVNPNSRPRAMDLAAILASMAVSGCLPDEALKTSLHEAHSALAHPW